MRYEIASAQILGERPNQEDGHWDSRNTQPTPCSPAPADPDDEVIHFIVADGMGGHVGGERASSLAISTTVSAYRGELEFAPPLSSATADSDLDYLEVLMHECHFNICDAAASDRDLEKMGSTAIIGLLTNWGLALAHCGDSRAYLLRDGVLQQLTKDQSLVQVLLDAGVIQPEEVRTHPRRHVVTAALGRDLSVQRLEVPLQPGDKLLICTDGFTDAVNDATIALALACPGTAKELCELLLEIAAAENPRDNTTATIVTVN